jgi:hypothetical protein
MSALRCQVSCDSAARAVGADALAAALQALGIAPRRTSSRGLFWLEPLLEVETPEGLMGFGPLAADELPGVLAALRDGTPHPKALGAVEALPFLARQQRLSFARAGRSEPLSLTDYEAQGGWVGLRAAQAMAPADIVAAGARLGAARARRRGLCGRHQVAHGAGRAGRRRKIPGLQCRRGRLRQLCRPHADGGRPLPAHRGHGHRGARARRARRLHLPALRVPGRRG